jgi:hypothetical protein
MTLWCTNWPGQAEGCSARLSSAVTFGFESEKYAAVETLSSHMGMFLQKTNVIRDYLVGGDPVHNWELITPIAMSLAHV